MPESVTTVFRASCPSTASARLLPTPKLSGIEGPVISASRIAVLKPSLQTLLARRDVTRDFPTPPFPLTIQITFLTELSLLRYACKSRSAQF